MGLVSMRCLATRAAVRWLPAALLLLPGLGHPGIAPLERRSPVGAGWLSTAARAVAEAEYAVGPGAGSSQRLLQAPNRSQGFRTLFDDDGVRVRPRQEGDAAWQVRLRLASVDGAGGHESVVSVRPVANANRVEYRRGELTEWYLNDERGLEQGFTLAAPPGGMGSGGPLRLELAVSGTATPRLDERSRVAFEHGGEVVLQYAGLRSWDARGRDLPSHMELTPAGADGAALSLVVDLSGAEYPVTVDPLVASPWVKDGGQAGARFGASLASADVNGDGYGDVIVGAPYYDTGDADAGRVFVFHGSPAGLSATPAWTADGVGAGALFGVVANAGDVNGDGYEDVIVGSPQYTNGEANEGSASVYLGGPSGIAAAPVWTAEGNQATAAFGTVVAGAGDVNGDGYADVVVGAPNLDNDQTNEGRVFVYRGSASGPGSTPWTAESNQAGALFGTAVAGGGDINGDGYSDLAVGAPNWYLGGSYTGNGRIFIYQGSATGLPAVPNTTRDAPNAQAGGHFGQCMAWAGDANGDRFADLLVGTPDWDQGGSTDAGRVDLYRGSAFGLSEFTPTWSVAGVQFMGRYGTAVASAGDIDGDGYADWLVGQPAYSSGETGEGAAFLYTGSSSLAVVPATSSLQSNQTGARLGKSLASAGDVNGDGFSDIVIGADGYDGALADEGRAFVYLGEPGRAIGTTAIWRYETNGYNLQFGDKVIHAGDVNGDGYPDIVVSNAINGYWTKTLNAFYGTGSGFASSPSWSFTTTSSDDSVSFTIGAAGDVNGDGYSDVVVGESSWDNGETNEGRALLFLGSAAGLGSSPAWAVELNYVAARFGSSVTGAGDVNGDGYADVIVGASRLSWAGTDSGAAFLYLGSSTGLSTDWSWFATGEQANAFAGGSVAGVGDVNGDGFADVAVGASGWTNPETSEGRVAVYLGSPTGPATSPSWTAEGNQGSAFFSGVGPAGDVNADGFADMVVVASGYDNGSTDEGRVYVYHGSSTGLSTTPSWTWEPNDPSQLMRAAAAGDVNGDGYGDLVVGRPGYGTDDQGRAHVFFGSGSGITGVSFLDYWDVSQTALYGAYFGSGVSTAGDVNGDGRAEIIVGASKWQNDYPNQVSEGAVFVYSMPAARAGRALTVRGGGQAALVPPEGRAHDSDDFQVRLTSVSPYGRVRIKVEVEACPPGAAWGSAGCTRSASPSWTDLNTASGVAITATVPGLVSRTLYRWRARTLYAPYFVTQSGIVAPAHPRSGPWRRWQGQTNSGDVRIDQGITVRLDQSAGSVEETNLQVVFGATMTTADGQPNLYPVTVQYQTANGTATAGSDYTATTATMTWLAGLGSTATQYRTIPLAGGDGLSEGPETFSILLSLPVSATLAAPTEEVITIVDSDPPLVSVADTSVVEGNSGTATASFTVTLSYASAQPASVSWATVPGSASAGSDFADDSGTVSFAPLQTSQTVQVAVNGDALDEGDEAFQVVLSGPLGAAPGDTAAVGTIENDDGPAGDEVTSFVATARNARVDLSWVYPAARDAVRVRYAQGATCVAPTDPETGGTLLGDFSGTAGEPGTAPPQLSLANGTQYCYRIWTVLGANSYLAGASTHARPFDDSAGQPGAPIAWAYTTGASNVAAPGLGGNVVLAVSNDKSVHVMVRGPGEGAGLWPSGYRPRVLGDVVQERPPLIGLPVVPGSTRFALLGSQDGSVYAVDTGSGGLKWQTPLLPAGSGVQGAPSAFFAAYGASYGVDFDVVVAATHSGAGDNRFYALEAATGAVLGTPYAGTGIGFVSGSATLDYPTKRAYFTSRPAGPPLNSLWCFDVDGSGLTLGWAKPAGEIDASPVLRGDVVYTSTIDGDVMAYSAVDGEARWTTGATPFPTEPGGVKGFIFPDRLTQRLYFSTTDKVWALLDNGTSASEAWSTTAVPSPSTLVFGDVGGTGYVFVGGGDGRLYQLDAATGLDVKWVQLAGATDFIGAPTLDVLNSMVYAGSTDGIVYAVKVPLR